MGGIKLEGICEADEVYVNSGDKGVKDDNPRRRGLSVKGRGTYDSDRPPVLTLVRRSDGMTEFVVLRDMSRAVEEIRSRASEDCVIITDKYPAYDRPDSIGINYMRINHSERYADGD
ncbi:MAG: transposase [Nitrososphaerota archaeon]|nr:transposase [Candidatus Calditenuis fumarioli]